MTKTWCHSLSFISSELFPIFYIESIYNIISYPHHDEACNDSKYTVFLIYLYSCLNFTLYCWTDLNCMPDKWYLKFPWVQVDILLLMGSICVLLFKREKKEEISVKIRVILGNMVVTVGVKWGEGTYSKEQYLHFVPCMRPYTLHELCASLWWVAVQPLLGMQRM